MRSSSWTSAIHILCRHIQENCRTKWSNWGDYGRSSSDYIDSGGRKDFHYSIFINTHFVHFSFFFVSLQIIERCVFTLNNLSVDEELGVKIAKSDLLHMLIKLLDREEVKVKESAGGVLANLALNRCNHNAMVEAGVIPMLVRIPSLTILQELCAFCLNNSKN